MLMDEALESSPSKIFDDISFGKKLFWLKFIAIYIVFVKLSFREIFLNFLIVPP